MEKIYTSLGLMSGTSMDGIDASIIRSNGEDKYEVVLDEYFKYDDEIYKELTDVRNKINFSVDLEINSTLLGDIERKITLFHASICKKIIRDYSTNIDLIGFHGQTIFHNANEKISKQLGDANLLSGLLKKKVVYNFRKNDMFNGGQGAPLAPIYHQLLANQNQIELPVCVLNIGGIANITIISSKDFNDLKSYDIGPGNCLLDEWIRKNSEERFDKNGELAKAGKISETILNQAIDNFDNIKNINKLSFDVKDFNLNFVRGLSLEDGLATLTDFTASIINQSILNSIILEKDTKLKILICGGGRKNLFLLDSIKSKLPSNMHLSLIDDYKINGDFIESQAFAYLAIRSYLKKIISFPKTTNVKSSCLGGVLVENY
ncbi:anhydro-N-acetylmuramic acid kinase [Candidatus Pelagibacter sp.]|nr:anhydro-N-acetylmuramic acid kinase [Candidatus Pelagibacter sp.]|tara:strand:- start:288 stop:1415 length:1128 start_codon:yes stop_codon:yes gene_type:complete